MYLHVVMHRGLLHAEKASRCPTDLALSGNCLLEKINENVNEKYFSETEDDSHKKLSATLSLCTQDLNVQPFYLCVIMFICVLNDHTFKLFLKGHIGLVRE